MAVHPLDDAFGHALCLGERECSMQRKHQKLIEECPSPAVDAGVRHEMCARINTALARMGYRNAGTMELLDEDGSFYFMEMNTRLQVEHPITEEVYGVDIVREQIRIAANHPLSMTQTDVRGRGHAIECRINAEDPANGFRPDPGRIETFRPGEGNGPGRVRIDTFIAEGFEIPPYYDSMICKVIAWGEDRPAAIATMIDTLHHFEIRGIKTTVPLHLDILNSDAFRSGRYHINTLTDLMGASSWPK